jgi:hypothetical protein
MKISKNHLRQIIKEELQNVLSEEENLSNLAGEIDRRNRIGKWIKWQSKEIYEDPEAAFSEMLLAAWMHWNTPGRSLKVGLPREHLATLAALRTSKLAALKSTADEGVLPENTFKMLDYFVPKNSTPDAALASGLGREHLRGGGSTNPFEDDDDL